MTTDTGGANLFWTSDEPAVAAARELALRGELPAAADALRQQSGSLAAREGLHVLRWIARDFSLDPASMLEKLRTSIPGVTADDVARWTTQRVLQHRTLDGKTCYFRSEPANLFRFCDEAKTRGLPSAAVTTWNSGDSERPWSLERHVERVIAEVDRTGAAMVVPIRQEVDYELSLVPADAGLHAGQMIRAWLPFPRVYRQQRDVRLVDPGATGRRYAGDLCPNDVGLGERTPLGHRSAEYGRPVAPMTISDADAPHRSLYFEHRITSPAEPVRFTATLAFTTSAYCPLLSGKPATDERATPADLAERAPHIVFTSELRSAVADAVGNETSPLEKARRIFHWVCQHIAYNAEEEYGIIPSLTAKALATRRGDCGVQGMLYIAMCRCAGIPARWQSGWQTQRVRWNMHDWCEVFSEPLGWIPVDPSYGLRTSDDPRVREFFFGNMDAYRMIVNADYGRPLVPPKQSLRSEPLDFQRGEVEVDGENLYFDRWQWRFVPRWVDDGP